MSESKKETLLNNIYKKVNSFDDCVMEVPLVEVYINKKFMGFHNELTIRKLQLACKKGDIDYKIVKIIFNENGYFINNNGRFVDIDGNFCSFEHGFYDLSYVLAFGLLD